MRKTIGEIFRQQGPVFVVFALPWILAGMIAWHLWRPIGWIIETIRTGFLAGWRFEKEWHRFEKWPTKDAYPVDKK